MGLRIATNIAGVVAQHRLAENTARQTSTIERLASGARINRSADDAAGLAISDTMRGHIRSIRQSVRNANDGISMIQTAEGAMSEVSNILVRFRELAIQASSDTVGDTERKFIDKEVQQLKQEINRIAESTEFNGRELLSGRGETVELQVGINNNPETDRLIYDLSSINASLDHLGLDGLSVAERDSAREGMSAVDSALQLLAENRAELGALQNRIQSTARNLNTYEENLSAAVSQIRDADIAYESAELTKNSILSQAGTAVLSQANQNNMLALKLL
jgi:flagellin